jgi:superfamily II DNA or RNA helicase
MNYKSIDFPVDLEYSTDDIFHPLEFFLNVIPKSKAIDFKLGYFSSSAIKELSGCFAEFIINNPKSRIRIMTNHFLDDIDKKLVFQEIEKPLSESKVEKWIYNDYCKLLESLSKRDQHFFECIKYLISKGRVQILPVISKGLVHYKEAIYEDFEGNKIYTNGSCNFTRSGIIENEESFDLTCSWHSENNLNKINSKKRKYDLIFSKKNKHYYYVNSITQIKNLVEKKITLKSINELLEDEIELNIEKRQIPERLKQIIDKNKQRKKVLMKQPRFPHEEPYPYQKHAYNAWVENGYKGLLAMATGTGKTLTSLYCLIEEFKINNIQKNIFVVPTEELVRQWADELRDCNFSNIFLWYGSVSSLKKLINDIKILKRGATINIIVTYISLKSETFQKIFKDSLKEFTVVFDEVHNLGAQGVRKALKGIEFNRTIGLSATPLRLWDDNGENIFIEEMFKSYHPDYTFSFPMEKAIGKFLVNYNYYPFFITLNNDEWERYLKYTRQIPFGGSENSINTTAALKRQLLLDQAEAKEDILIDIVGKLVEEKKYKRTLVYCPKGRHDKEDEDRIIKDLQSSVSDKFQNLNIQLFVGATKDRKELLQDFENDEVDMLFSIKVLDEGVNVPMAENAIFLASGKNYREFVQRRGRVLRKYKTAVYEKTHANIYDIVVLPSIEQYNSHRNTAKKLIVAEFKRLFEFFNMSYRDNDVFWKIEQELEKYNLSQYHIEKIIKDEQEQHFTGDSEK